MERYYDEQMGWGKVEMETEHYLIVRYDADPWCLVQVPKAGE